MNDLILWEAKNGEVIPHSAKTPAAILKYVKQVEKKDLKLLIEQIEIGQYEFALNYLWNATIKVLKRELTIIGLELLCEMLGKINRYKIDDVSDILTSKDTIKLSLELGMISSTEANSLRDINNTINRLKHLVPEKNNEDKIDETKIIAYLKVCIRSVLGKPKIEVSEKFVNFRAWLEEKTLKLENEELNFLQNSPYFFNKLIINVLMNASKKNTSTNIEHVLANINNLVPLMWENLKDTEKWQVGYTYAEVYSEGKSTTVEGLKSVLLKVKGFDYVPETLRNNMFIKSAEEIIKVHEGLNNFYEEARPVKNLSKLGSQIPVSALPICITALLCVVMGNSYGSSWEASDTATKLLKEIKTDQWEYYLSDVLPSETRILYKLQDSLPINNWIKLFDKINLKIEITNKTVKQLINNTKKSKENNILKYSKKLINEYYGKK